MNAAPKLCFARRAALLAVFAMIVAACGAGDRPTVADWQGGWDSVVAAIPTQEELGDPPDMELCAATLGTIREAAPDLRTTPDLAADDAVSNWLKTAESTFFGCPPESGEIDSLAKAYDELARLEVEVTVALGLESR